MEAAVGGSPVWARWPAGGGGYRAAVTRAHTRKLGLDDFLQLRWRPEESKEGHGPSLRPKRTVGDGGRGLEGERNNPRPRSRGQARDDRGGDARTRRRRRPSRSGAAVPEDWAELWESFGKRRLVVSATTSPHKLLRLQPAQQSVVALGRGQDRRGGSAVGRGNASHDQKSDSLLPT